MVGTAVVGVACAPAARAACADWHPLDNQTPSQTRQMTAEDLIGLVDFGRPDAEPIGGPSALAVSPDGSRVAVILQRADLAGNGYCQALVLLDPRGRAAPRVLDRGGDFLMTSFALRGMYMSNGFPRLNAPAWSRDGRSIAYLRRDHGSTRVWRVRLDDAPAAPVTPASVDVDAWTWAADGHALIYASAPGRAAAEAAIDEEGLSGWRYDARTAPVMGVRPQVPAPLPRSVSAIDPDSGTPSVVTAADTGLLDRDGEDPLDRHRRSARGDAAWAAPDGTSPFAPWRLHALGAQGGPYACTSAACAGSLRGLWWDPDGRRLTFVKAEGWNERYTAIYRWVPGKGQPVRLLRTDDDLAGCVAVGTALICVREGATRPPRLVSIDLGTGRERPVFDPNPSSALWTLGPVRRLEWLNDIGNQVYGDLVLPPGYHGGKLPTIVVQYSSRGFLRGGTGNDYPIFLLAARGFAVLSIEKPRMVAASHPNITSYDEVAAINTRDWAERRNVHSAIVEGVKILVADGIADPARIGITGLSDGASSVRYALINSHLFAAAAISSCCVDESSDMLVGPAWEAYSVKVGYPPSYPRDEAFWQPYSPALNAARMDTPLLMQLADSEMLTALPTVTALRAYSQPVDLYTFPQEFHIKWQPQHRRAVYERNLDWFSFWLQGREDPAPGKAAQFALWRAMRDRRDEARRAGGVAPASGP